MFRMIGRVVFSAGEARYRLRSPSAFKLNAFVLGGKRSTFYTVHGRDPRASNSINGTPASEIVGVLKKDGKIHRQAIRIKNVDYDAGWRYSYHNDEVYKIGG